MCFGSPKPPKVTQTEPPPVRRAADGPTQSSANNLRRRATGFNRTVRTSPLGVTNFGDYSVAPVATGTPLGG